MFKTVYTVTYELFYDTFVLSKLFYNELLQMEDYKTIYETAIAITFEPF